MLAAFRFALVTRTFERLDLFFIKEFSYEDELVSVDVRDDMPYKDPEARKRYHAAYGAAYYKAVLTGVRTPIKGGTAPRAGEEIKCSECGSMFYRCPAARRTTNMYCSEECMGEAFKGRMLGDRSPRWKGVETRLGVQVNETIISVSSAAKWIQSFHGLFIFIIFDHLDYLVPIVTKRPTILRI
jgi:predicted RNA-binding Zn-ribbon protein involved in translation (DUF1610 family)